MCKFEYSRTEYRGTYTLETLFLAGRLRVDRTVPAYVIPFYVHFLTDLTIHFAAKKESSDQNDTLIDVLLRETTYGIYK